MLGLSQLRLGIYAAIALAFVGLLAKDHFTVKRLNAANHRAAQAEANLVALQAAQAHERKISKEATDDYESRLQALAVSAADTPVRSVRLCRSPTGYVPAPSPAPSGVDAGTSPGLPQEPGFHPGYGNSDRWGDAGPDVGPELYELADKADKAVAQCSALMFWVRSR